MAVDLAQRMRARALELTTVEIPRELDRSELLERLAKELILSALPAIEQKLESGELATELAAFKVKAGNDERACAALLKAYLQRSAKWIAARAVEHRDEALRGIGETQGINRQLAQDAQGEPDVSLPEPTLASSPEAPAGAA